ncbi:hypothetical protein M899_0069 [Bacteriovorax sp. BSW11_IV]|uniref:hypothetical protein n=1 Tax=Bacteriovorax sp. BSW11_IV TaxID=1353529 RepID=UPI00038A0C7E|nr:hypothetical protein [Bacteriovorax sp. BSW11_IV]EQC42893.1 hypothetical protein M899_0069 [Bacteriovorax sp. BSW11_IV]
MAVIKKKKKAVPTSSAFKTKAKEQLKKIFLSSQGLPIFLTISIIGILFVLFRMKGVELNYNITSINRDIEQVVVEGKELKARKARMLSVNNLRKMAKKFDLSEPKQHQIIVIP